jgi:hypothetical protein
MNYVVWQLQDTMYCLFGIKKVGVPNLTKLSDVTHTIYYTMYEKTVHQRQW